MEKFITRPFFLKSRPLALERLYVKIFDKKELKCGEDDVVNSVTYRGSFLLKSLIDGNYHMWKNEIKFIQYTT
jgi:hypothetical protein